MSTEDRSKLPGRVADGAVLCPVTMEPCEACGERCEERPPEGPCGTRPAHRWRTGGSDMRCKECHAYWTPPATCPMDLADRIRAPLLARIAELEAEIEFVRDLEYERGFYED